MADTDYTSGFRNGRSYEKERIIELLEKLIKQIKEETNE
jgi:hypothetical protein